MIAQTTASQRKQKLSQPNLTEQGNFVGQIPTFGEKWDLLQNAKTKEKPARRTVGDKLNARELAPKRGSSREEPATDVAKWVPQAGWGDTQGRCKRDR